MHACQHWYHIVCDLHKFFIAIARSAVNDDGLGGSACNPLVWRADSLPNRRKIVEAVREFAMWPGPQALWSGGWQDWAELCVTAEDARIWFFSVGSLVKLVAFLSSLRWPSEFHDLGPGGILFY